MGKPFDIKVGQSIDLPITWDDGAGNPAEVPTDISFKQTPDGMVSTALAADFSKVTVTGLKAGTVTLEIDATGDGSLSDSDQGTIALPLARAIHLNP